MKLKLLWNYMSLLKVRVSVYLMHQRQNTVAGRTKSQQESSKKSQHCWCNKRICYKRVQTIYIYFVIYVKKSSWLKHQIYSTTMTVNKYPKVIQN